MNTISEQSAVKSTPLPWEVREPGKHSKDKFRVVHVHGTSIDNKEIAGGICEILTSRCSADNFSDVTERANAELIVKAVNCHGYLVEALKHLLEDATPCLEHSDKSGVLVEARYALKKAGAL